MLDAPPFSGATEAGNHLVGDEQRAVFLRDRFHRMHPVVRRNDISRGALDRLDEDRGDRPRRAVLDLLPRKIGARDATTRIAQLERTAIAIGIGHEVATAGQRPVALLPFVANVPDDAAGLAMKAAPETHHLEL